MIYRSKSNSNLLVVIVLSNLLLGAGCKKPENERVAAQLHLTPKEVDLLHSRASLSNQALLKLESSQARTILRELRPDLPQQRAAFRNLQLRGAAGAIPPQAIMQALFALQGLRLSTRREAVGGMKVGMIVDLRSLSPNPSGPQPEPKNWEAVGPSNVGGRTRSILIDPNSPDHIWIGSVGGGVWRSDNSGKDFYPADDFMANLAICCMVMDPTDSSSIYAGTGEGFYANDAIRGAGIFLFSKKTKGKWELLPGSDRPEMQFLDRIAISSDGKVLLAAAQNGKPLNQGHLAGMYRRNDLDPKSWDKVLDGEVTDIKFHPSDPLKAVASGFFDAWYSTTGGKSWQVASHDEKWQGRVELAYARKDPLIVYALVDSNGGEVWKSEDGGQSYKKRDTRLSISGATILGSQGWYDNSIWAGDPTNADFLIVGGINLWRSSDGGQSFADISNWRNTNSVHSDQHAIVADPAYNGTTNKAVFFGNDGGVYKAMDVSSVGSDDARTNGWISLNTTYASTQFYGAAGSLLSGTIIGGAQDNGTLELDKGASIDNWGVMSDGDGGFCFAHPSRKDVFYGEYVNLDLLVSRDGAKSTLELSGLVRWRDDGKADWKPDPYYIPDAKSAINDHLQTANFIAPFVLDMNEPKRVYAGGLSLWRTEDADVEINDSSGPSWASVKGPISDAAPDGLISAIAVTPGNSDIVWVGYNNGRLFKTLHARSANPDWIEIAPQGPSELPRGRMCTRIVLDATDQKVVYVLFGGYEKDNIWKSLDGGGKWNSVHANLPAMPIFALTSHPKNKKILYLASELGVFTSLDGGSHWSPANTGPANCSVQDLFWMGDTLVAATHGRGIFKIDLTLSQH